MSTAIMTAPAATPVRHVLQTNVALMLAMSGTMFACAEGSPSAAVAVPVAWIGLMFVDRQSRLRINHWGANGLSLLALAAVGMEFFGESLEGRLLAIGHLLCYLSWILLLQRKETRQFWWLCALSVLQVATSAVLTNSPWLGLGLIVYVTHALFTLSVFSLDRAVSRSAGVQHQATVSGDAPRHQGSVSRNAVRLETAAKWITPRFVAGVVVNGLLSMILGLALFILIPRVWVDRSDIFGGQALPTNRSVTGATDAVSLGDIGQILENPDLVMEVRFWDMQTEQPIAVEEFLSRLGYDAPLYRGSVLDEYRSGRWSVADIRESHAVSWNVGGSQSRYLRQEIRLRPTGSSTLYVAQRAVTCLPHDEIEEEGLRNTFHRTASAGALRSELFEYQAYSRIAATMPSWRTTYFRQDRYLDQTAAFPPNLEPVRKLAQHATQSADGVLLTPEQSVQRLMTLLRDSGEYRYSLKAAVSDRLADPIVDFLVNRKEGHCEYFASALALMLRAVGIQSRLISGFKGGAYNERTKCYEVRQLHAHAWVEAYVDGEWIVLDPTPAERDQTVNLSAATSHFWIDSFGRLRDWWSTAMLLTATQQRRMLFNPLQESAGGWVRSLSEAANELTAGAILGDSSTVKNPETPWQGIFGGLFFFAVVLTGLYWGARLVMRRGGRAERSKRSRLQFTGPPVPFYERFRALLARTGRIRHAAQTQREFAASLRRDWRSNGHPALDELPEVVTSAFYQIRFGAHPLPPQDVAALDASLDHFEQSLRNGGAATPAKPSGR